MQASANSQLQNKFSHKTQRDFEMNLNEVTSNSKGKLLGLIIEIINLIS